MKRYILLHMGILGHQHKNLTADAMKEAGIGRSQPWILNYLADHEGCIQRELAHHSHFDPASITSALTGMEEQGLVTREVVDGDKRALRVTLTEKGWEKERVVQEIFTEVEEKALTGFSAEEKELLNGFLSRIHGNLNDFAVQKGWKVDEFLPHPGKENKA